MNLETQLALRSRTELRAATSAHGNPLQVAGDDSGPTLVWVYSDDAYGWPRGLVTGGTFEAAYYAAVEMLPPVPQSEMHDAYGMTREGWDVLCVGECSEWPDMASGYTYGDYDVFYTADLTMRPLTVEEIRAGDIGVVIRHWDAPSEDD